MSDLVVFARKYFTDSALVLLKGQQISILRSCVRESPANIPVSQYSGYINLLELITNSSLPHTPELLLPCLELASLCCCPVSKTESNQELLIDTQFNTLLSCLSRLTKMCIDLEHSFNAMHAIYLCAAAFIDNDPLLSSVERQHRSTLFLQSQFSADLSQLSQHWHRLSDKQAASLAETLCLVVDLMPSHTLNDRLHPLVESCCSSKVFPVLVELSDSSIQVI